MTISDADFAAWLAAESRPRVMLVELDWLLNADPIGFDVNVANASRGATATATSEDPSGSYPPSAAIDGERTGAGAYWAADPTRPLPQAVTVTFNGLYLVDRVALYSRQDGAPVTPVENATPCFLHQIRIADVQVWAGAEWITVASLDGNFQAKRTLTFAPRYTTAIRVVVNASADGKATIVEIEALTPSSVTGTEYLATHPFVAKPTDSRPNQIYRSIVKRLPGFVQRMNDVLIGRTTANLGAIEVVSSQMTDAWLFERSWIGRGVRLYVGDLTWSRDDYRPVWHGVIGDLRVQDDTTLVVEARDMQHLLSQPLRVSEVPAGPLLMRPMPVAIGNVFNAPAILLDEATHLYAIHDGSTEGITQVRDRGVSVSFTDLGNGTFTLPSQPVGRVTVDAKGAVGGDGPVRTAADIIRYLVVTLGYLDDDDLDVDSFATLNALCPQLLALYTNAVGKTVLDLVDEVCATVGAFSAVTRDGRFYVQRLDFDGTPVMTITESADIAVGGLRVEKILPPVRDIRIVAGRNYSPNTYTAGGSGSGVSETNVNTYQNAHRSMGKAVNAAATTAAVPRARVYRVSGDAASTVSAIAKDEGAYVSLFTNQADAQAEAERRMRLWGFTRYLFSVTCNIKPLTLRLGDTVRLVHRRYGLAGGRNGVVVSLDERFAQRKTVLGVMV